jgi:hypothetical protein
MDQIVVPLRAKLAARGEALYVNLCYVAFTSGIASGIYAHSDPAEYAEFLLATFQHLQSRYGWVPDGIEVILEPDNRTIWANTSGTLIGQAIKAAGDRLAAAGFHPDFIAPSVMNNSNGPAYIDNLVRGARCDGLREGVFVSPLSGRVDGRDREPRAGAGIGASMLEWWDTP